MKAVFHVPAGDEPTGQRALGNVANLLDDPTIDLDAVALVANSDGVELLLERSVHRDDVVDLVDRGVTVSACRNSIERASFDAHDLANGVGTVPSAMGALARLQHEGYAYIRP